MSANKLIGVGWLSNLKAKEGAEPIMHESLKAARGLSLRFCRGETAKS